MACNLLSLYSTVEFLFLLLTFTFYALLYYSREASDDLHASNLIRGLRAEDPEADIRGWGGDLMREAGAEIVRHYKDTAIMGFLTVLKNLGKIKANIRFVVRISGVGNRTW